MSQSSLRRRPAAARLLSACAVAVLAIALSGCYTARQTNQLVGTWSTTLVGYNKSASAATQYQQTVVFGDDGKVVVTRTLPAPYDRQTGTYRVTKLNGNQVIEITWASEPNTPSILFFKVDGSKLMTSLSSAGLAKPAALNANNADPVVYNKR